MKILRIGFVALFVLSSMDAIGENDNKKDELPDASTFDLSIDKDDIPDDVKQLLSPDALPDLSAEMALQYLLQYAPEKPEWIYARKMLEAQIAEARAKKVRKYKEVVNTTIVPFGVQYVKEKISLEPFKFSNVSFIDAAGTAWPVLSAKSSNDSFVVLDDKELPDAKNISPNTIIIRSTQDYSEANLIVYLKDYEYPLLVKLETGSDIVEPVRTLKLMSSAPVDTSEISEMSGKKAFLSSSDELREFLIEPPVEAEIIPVKGSGVEVFKLGTDYFVVTRYQINVPYQEVEYGNGEVRVYKVVSESMLDTLTFTHKGELITFDVMLEG